MIKVSAFRWVPPFAQGHVRDLRVRWALEEAGIPYEENLIGFEDQASPAYRSLQPFGQVPAIEGDGPPLFESGAIVLHIAERSEALMSDDPDLQALTKTWMFAALNTIEPQVQQLGEIDFFHAGKAWAKERRPEVIEMIDKRLTALSDALGDKAYLVGDFSAADILMTTVLRILDGTDVLTRYPMLAAYSQRCQARPAFKAALAAQLAPFKENAPAA